MPHLLWHGASVYNSPRTRDTHTFFISVEQWSCHYLYLRFMSVADGVRTPNLPLAGPTLLPTVPPPQIMSIFIMIYNIIINILIVCSSTILYKCCLLFSTLLMTTRALHFYTSDSLKYTLPFVGSLTLIYC